MRIRLVTKTSQLTGHLKETPTARQLWEVLPVESSAGTWGEEVYFSVPLKASLEADAQEVVDPGTLCFWVQGQSLAIPFGPTPASRGNECRLVTRVNILGKLQDDLAALKSVRDGDVIRVERLPT